MKGIISAPKAPMAPHAPSMPHMSLVKPNYSQRTPIVNDSHFVDGNPPLATPTINSPSASFNPGQGSSPLPNGPPRFIQPQGKRPMAKGLTNKRITQTI